MIYRPEIDGLRAIAVIPVIMFHAGIGGFEGGFVGVDVFFVISGYLITTIILTEKEKGTFSLMSFYERRARRILPALFLVMFVSLPFAWLWLYPTDLKNFAQSLVAVATFISNFLFWFEADYFDTASELKPLLHTWSLAVEEQYYFLFPLFLMLMWRFPKHWILGSFLLIAVISLITAQWAAFNQPAANFFLLPTRGWELAIGASISFYFIYRGSIISGLRSHKSVEEILGFVGLSMIGFAVYAYDETVPFPSAWALVPTIGTGLIIIFASSKTIVGDLLSSKFIVGIGLISYSAYLWHQPLFAFARHRSATEPSQVIIIFLALLSFLLAYLSWKYVEKPFRTKGRFSRKTIFTVALTGSLVFVAIGLAGHLNDGYKQRGIYSNLLVANYQPDNMVLQQNSWSKLRKLSGNENYGPQNNEYDRKLWYAKKDGRKRILLIGNSHSKDLYNVLLHSNDAKTHFQIARYGVQISKLTDFSSGFYSTPNYKQSDLVVLVSKYYEEDLPAIEVVVEKLRKDNKSVVLVKHIFEFSYRYPRNTADFLLQKKILNGPKLNNESIPDVVDEINDAYYREFASHIIRPIIIQSDMIISRLKDKYRDLKVLDRMDYVCSHDEKKCFAINQQLEKFFYDYGHHTLAGAAFFGNRVDLVNWISPLIQ